LPPCLSCKRENRRFTSEEHVIPESLGNRKMVLPKGVVCDQCNNEKLSMLDQALLDFVSISAMKTFLGVPSKTGTLPKSKFGNGSLGMFAPRNVLFRSNSPKAFRVRPGTGDDPNRVLIDMTFKSSRPMSAKYCRKLTRALLKMLLGGIYIDDESRETKLAFSEKFDPLRNKILDQTKFDGYFALMRNSKNPGDQGIALSYRFIPDEANIETVGVEFQYYGTLMCTDSEMLGLRHLEKWPKDQVNVFSF